MKNQAVFNPWKSFPTLIGTFHPISFKNFGTAVLPVVILCQRKILITKKQEL